MPFQRILVPMDFSHSALAAADLAVGMARATGAHVSLVHIGVFPHFASVELSMMGGAGPTVTRMSEEVAAKVLERLSALAEDLMGPQSQGGPVEHSVVLREGYPPFEILAEVQEKGHDLVVMGTHGRTGVERLLLGSVADRVVRTCPVPVMVTHGAEPRKGKAADA